MPLHEFIAGLSSTKQGQLALHFCRLALPVWEEYAAYHSLEYRDSVVGLDHTVKERILEDALVAVEAFTKKNAVQQFFAGKESLMKVRSAFDDPITALQDLDWELPYAVERIFYAVYNLLNWLIGKEKSPFGESVIYVAINQAADAFLESKRMTVEEINEALAGFKT